MNIKALIFFFVFSLGFALGVYLLITTGSYLLLFFTSFFGILFGYLFGNLAKQSLEIKEIRCKNNTDIKCRK